MKELLNLIPHEPGIYKMLDENKKIIYIGKAKDLKKRVSSYFQKDYEHSSRTKKMIGHIRDVQWIQTDSELEALILENTLVRDQQPRYNILLKDDKSYAYIKIQTGEDFPRISVVRERTLEVEGLEKKGVKYFGPKLASNKVYETLKLLKKLFPYRHCRLDIEYKGDRGKGMGDGEIQNTEMKNAGIQNAEIKMDPKPESVEVKNRVIDFPCLDYYIKRCPGPCIGAVTPEKYGENIKKILDFLGGRSETLEKELESEMMEAAAAKQFEKAAKTRDKLFAIRSILQQQKITHPLRQDTDVIHFTTELGHIYYSILIIRKGKLIDQQQFVFDALEMSETDATIDISELFESLLVQYYERAGELPKEIIVPWELDGRETVEIWLSNKKGEKVSITIPQRGEKNELLELALKNAVSFAKQHRIKWLSQQKNDNAVNRLKEVIGLTNKHIKRIEGYDISHLGGNETVASMVVFENGVAKSSDYRHFKLRTVDGKPDDYKSMHEVLLRRLKYLAKAKSSTIRIGNCAKKDFPIIAEIIKDKQLASLNLEQKDIVVAKEEKKIIGFGRLVFLDKNLALISNIFVAPEARGKKLGYEIIQKLVRKNKVKKVYVEAIDEVVDYYAVFGFVPLKKVPDQLLEYTKKADQAAQKITYMVYEVRKLKIDPSFGAKPDLILIDGGKGQLGMAVAALKEMKLEIPVISLAKKFEEIFLPDTEAPILLDEGDEARALLQRIRDESHRFAITFQRDLHRKALINS